MKQYIKGNYRQAIYESEKGYVIGLFKINETNIEAMKDFVNRSITFTGYFHDLNFDDTYILYGEDIMHPRYGHQFNVKEYERVKPEDKEGIATFLASDLFPGLGEKMALRIVDTLGDDTLDKILHEPESLALVPRLTTKKAKMIHETLVKYEESHSTIVYLCDLGFTMKDSLKIYNTYHENTINVLENNIYKVLDDITELNFTAIDKLQSKFEIANDDERRMKALIIHVMKYISFQNGDTYLTIDEILDGIYKHSKVTLNNKDVESYFKDLMLEGKIVLENSKVYLSENYEAEMNIVNKIKLLSKIPDTIHKNIEGKIEQLEFANNIFYNDEQKKAITTALTKNITIITGGPGTGKTTIIKAIVELYKSLNKLSDDAMLYNLALLAPTGRAAKRMSESTMYPAKTIHRFLKWNKETGDFAINEFNKDASKLIIIDEVSMIDLKLLDSLFKGLFDNVKVIMVGDYHQLPSVGEGQILKDFIESNVIDLISLNRLYRQDEDSYISKLAFDINNGTIDDDFNKSHSDYKFLECSPRAIKQSIKNISSQIKEKGYNYKQVQFLAPMYRGENGIDALNAELQEIFNPNTKNKNQFKFGDIYYREDDKVLQLVNMPDENVYNGDIGIIREIISSKESESKKTEIIIDYEGNLVKYYPSDLTKIKHGYITSIHKSQGSEFEIVVMPMTHSYNRMLYRKLIYTGITRAKKKLILVGEKDAFFAAINNNSEQARKTTLREKLEEIKLD